MSYHHISVTFFSDINGNKTPSPLSYQMWSHLNSFTDVKFEKYNDKNIIISLCKKMKTASSSRNIPPLTNQWRTILASSFEFCKQLLLRGFSLKSSSIIFGGTLYFFLYSHKEIETKIGKTNRKIQRIYFTLKLYIILVVTQPC
jgi:hypothetical protein